MLDRHQYRIRGVFIVVLFALFIFLFYGLVSTELFKLQSNKHFRYALSTELNYYLNKDVKYDQYIDEYIQDNYDVMDRGLTSLLNTAKAKLEGLPAGVSNTELAIQSQIAFKDTPNNLEIFAIKKDDLFKSIKYRYILDEFKGDENIHMLKLNVFREKDIYTVKRSAYFYDPRLEVLVVVEKIMEPELVNKENIKESLYTYSLVSNGRTLGDILLVDKSGRVIYDSHNVIGNNVLDGIDLTSQKPIMDIISDKAGGFVEFTLPNDGKRKLAYVIYSNAHDGYYINMIDKSRYYEDGSEGRLQMLMAVAISMTAVALLFILFVIRRTVRLLGDL